MTVPAQQPGGVVIPGLQVTAGSKRRVQADVTLRKQNSRITGEKSGMWLSWQHALHLVWNHKVNTLTEATGNETGVAVLGRSQPFAPCQRVPGARSFCPLPLSVEQIAGQIRGEGGAPGPRGPRIALTRRCIRVSDVPAQPGAGNDLTPVPTDLGSGRTLLWDLEDLPPCAGHAGPAAPAPGT